MADFNVEVTLRTQTCSQQHTYAVPLAAAYTTPCPLCARGQRDAWQEREAHLKRQVSSLRGALTRAKKVRRG